MEPELTGKVVIVTGAAEGLGLAMLTSFLEQGIQLGIMLDVNEEKGNEEVANLKQKYGNDRAVFYKCDVTKDIDEVYQTVVNNHKNIDVFINNAGIVDEINVRKTMSINAIAMMEWTMKFYEYMRIDKGGRGGTIINVSSIFGFRITPFAPFYHASKYAMLGFSKSIGHERNFKKSSVRVLTLCPGVTHTSIGDKATPWGDNGLAELLDEIKNYDWQEPSDVGDGAVEIFKKGESGSVWLVEGARPAEKMDI